MNSNEISLSKLKFPHPNTQPQRARQLPISTQAIESLSLTFRWPKITSSNDTRTHTNSDHRQHNSEVFGTVRSARSLNGIAKDVQNNVLSLSLSRAYSGQTDRSTSVSLFFVLEWNSLSSVLFHKYGCCVCMYVRSPEENWTLRLRRCCRVWRR